MRRRNDLVLSYDSVLNCRKTPKNSDGGRNVDDERSLKKKKAERVPCIFFARGRGFLVYSSNEAGILQTFGLKGGEPETREKTI